MADDMQNAFRSARLQYRALEQTDEDKTFYHKIQNIPSVFSSSDSSVLRPQTKTRMDEEVKERQKSLIFCLICLPKESSTEVTSIGMIALDNEPEDWYRHHHRTTTLQISILPEFQNKGYGSEAINWALDWAFLRANIHSVSLGCMEYNDRGKHLYEKLGFVLEGRFRKSVWHERKWWDMLLFSMLEDEWEALRGWKKS